MPEAPNHDFSKSDSTPVRFRIRPDSHHTRSSTLPYRFLTVAFLIASISLLKPTTVQAIGHVIENRGERISDVGAVIEKHAAEVQLATRAAKTVRVGFVYDYNGLYFVDFWTWGGRFCLYEEDKFWELTPAQAGDLLGKPADQLSKPWRYRFPVGLVLLAALVLFVSWFPISHRLSRRRKAGRYESLLADPRYQRAVLLLGVKLPEDLRPETMQAFLDGLSGAPTLQPEELPPGVFEQAVSSLTADGIDRPTAEKNLYFLIDELDFRATMARL